MVMREGDLQCCLGGARTDLFERRRESSRFMFGFALPNNSAPHRSTQIQNSKRCPQATVLKAGVVW